MRLNARVHKVTGATIHYEASAEGPRPMPAAARVEIVDENGGFMLIRYSAEGAFAGDTWHATLEEAKRQAHFEFYIPEEGWEPQP